MKTNSTILAFVIIGLISITSCKKKSAVAVLPAKEADPNVPTTPAATTMTATAAAYDYSKPIEQIIADAGIEEPIADPYLVLVRSGRYLFEYQDRVICDPVGPVCEILVIEWKTNRVNSAGNNTVIEGSAENPIRVVQALPQWPVYRRASQVSYNETGNPIEILHSYLP